ncbi:hypothetical protein AO31_04084 [Mycobacterium tuberculosis M1638]|nr:hypothetical protein AO31_04084 [Mycobacterium tuberculosis M1638]
MCAVAVSAPRPVSSDPKPREGTETHIGDGDAARGHAESSDPKPREGTETHIGDGDAARGHAESSDPKPREGTETRGAAWHGRRG